MPEGRPGQGGPQNTAAGTTITDAADIASQLELSDERDAQLRLRHEAFRAGFRAGYGHGRAAGRAEAEREMAAAWARIAKPIARGGPTYAELQKRRRGGAAA